MVRCRPSGVPLDDISDASVPLMSAKTCPKAGPVCPVCMQSVQYASHSITSDGVWGCILGNGRLGAGVPHGWYIAYVHSLTTLKGQLGRTYKAMAKNLQLPKGTMWASCGQVGNADNAAGSMGKQSPKCLALRVKLT